MDIRVVSRNYKTKVNLLKERINLSFDLVSEEELIEMTAEIDLRGKITDTKSYLQIDSIHVKWKDKSPELRSKEKKVVIWMLSNMISDYAYDRNISSDNIVLDAKIITYA